ncbi:Gfo/Idh/MocA family oxidoreductase [Francisella sp. 19X1-34]|uniref:Gfo/Idh/MocA family protein n=1 Tax=Francisella sp. 19X1-34 TaxID=3087177 RepID=UPI002E3277F3|nr:Gfo/Idh/MocA family oxidoreductase [Francisella sp. 19X1-34]MED7788603.1 Gfo/Idh/MocA family oxidoreductase [Francisella sp. 19X1-34]
MKEVRWGIIGCGKVTEVKSGPAFYKVKGSKLVAVMRRDIELAKDYAERHNVSKYYDNADDLINDNDVNAVYIATPPSFHKEYTIKAAKAGKAVYVEKPMAMNHQECLEMIAACKENNVPLYVAYYKRSLPRYQKIKSLIQDEKIIGNPRFVNCVLYDPFEKRYQDPENLPWHVIKEISGGGLFMDVGCHTLDILDYLLGKIVDVESQVTNQINKYPVEDSVAISFSFENGVVGTGIWNFSSYTNYDNIEIVGDKGKISFSMFGEGPIKIETESQTQSISLAHPENVSIDMVGDVVNSILDNKNHTPSSADISARTNRIIDKVYSS